MAAAEQIFGIGDKVALITGGCRGIGAAIALGFAEMGAKIAYLPAEASLPRGWSRWPRKSNVAYCAMAVGDYARMLSPSAGDVKV
jgi:NAD(P)-dependent dehydrogenase (short-subunit alcohol dehydrogenase family)